MINEFFEGIEFAIYGKRTHNLEINLEKIPAGEKTKNKLWALSRYTGSFIVTEKGYLIAGCDKKLDKEAAVICDTEIIPPKIHYANGNDDTIINDFWGLRLLQYKNQLERKCCFKAALA